MAHGPSQFLPFLTLARQHWRFYRRVRVIRLRDVVGIFVLSTLTVVAEAGGLAMILPILSFVEQGRDPAAFAAASSFGRHIVTAYSQLGIPVSIPSLSIAALALIMLRQAINYLNGLEVERVKWTIGRRLSVMFFGAVLGSNAANIRGYKPGQFGQIADYECQAAAAIVRVYGTLWQQLVSFVAYSAVLVVTAPLASLVAGSIILFSVICLGFLVRTTKRLSTVGVEIRRSQIDFLNERFRAWKLIKLGGTLDQETRRMTELAAQIAGNQLRMTRVAGILMLVFVPMMAAFMLTMLYVFVEVLALPMATVVLFVAVLLRLTPISQASQKQLSLLAQFTPSMELLDVALARARDAAEEQTNGRELTGVRSEIHFEDVSFTYPDRETAALSGISCSIPARALVALVGPSGSGKSTLVDLLPRIICPMRGRVLIDGEDSATLSLRSLRRAISYVPQEPFLLDASVADNIRYLRPEATQAEIEEVARLANADGFIRALPQGYATPLGDAGGRLSGGQKQRIVLARAFLMRAPVLILDEPTSALDYESERAIQESIETLVQRGETTVIVIAHRISTVRNADLVVQLENGRIARTGTPAEVLHTAGGAELS
ncbi:MAG: ABC transporter ATP-binding protein [Alphaproteobacteria bacterium]|nr:ABC transporter ATP-binding protein [Alphaproteobacteria bacterium]